MLVCILVLRIDGFGFLVIMMVFRLLVRGILFILVVLGFVGRDYCRGEGNIPKHCFCAWLAIRDRLATRDRLSRWDSSISLSCNLCGGVMSLKIICSFHVLLGVKFGYGPSDYVFFS